MPISVKDFFKTVNPTSEFSKKLSEVVGKLTQYPPSNRDTSSSKNYFSSYRNNTSPDSAILLEMILDFLFYNRDYFFNNPEELPNERRLASAFHLDFHSSKYAKKVFNKSFLKAFYKTVNPSNDPKQPQAVLIWPLIRGWLSIHLSSGGNCMARCGYLFIELGKFFEAHRIPYRLVHRFTFDQAWIEIEGQDGTMIWDPLTNPTILLSRDEYQEIIGILEKQAKRTKIRPPTGYNSEAAVRCFNYKKISDTELHWMTFTGTKEEVFATVHICLLPPGQDYKIYTLTEFYVSHHLLDRVLRGIPPFVNSIRALFSISPCEADSEEKWVNNEWSGIFGERVRKEIEDYNEPGYDPFCAEADPCYWAKEQEKACQETASELKRYTKCWHKKLGKALFDFLRQAPSLYAECSEPKAQPKPPTQQTFSARFFEKPRVPQPSLKRKQKKQRRKKLKRQQIERKLFP